MHPGCDPFWIIKHWQLGFGCMLLESVPRSNCSGFMKIYTSTGIQFNQYMAMKCIMRSVLLFEKIRHFHWSATTQTMSTYDIQQYQHGYLSSCQGMVWSGAHLAWKNSLNMSMFHHRGFQLDSKKQHLWGEPSVKIGDHPPNQTIRISWM